MGSELVLISRTDAEAANLIDSNIDARDTPYIMGVVGGDENVMKTFPDAVLDAGSLLFAHSVSVHPRTRRHRTVCP